MEFRTLEGVALRDLLHTFNASFADYFVPLQLTEAQLAAKMKADRTDLALSVGAFEDQKLVGFILHGLATIDHQKVGYNGGTGVVPEQRGAGLTQRMYRFVLPLLEKAEVVALCLEVVRQNRPAILSYEKTGFRTTRTLICFKGAIQSTASHPAITIQPLPAYDWEELASFWDIQPTWQNANPVMDRVKADHDARGAYWEGELVGYVLYHPANHRLHQLAVHKAYRRQGIASALLAALAQQHGTTFSVINIDSRATHVVHFFYAIGLEPFLEQLEMELLLPNHYY